MTYKKLTPEIKKQLLDKIENLDVDVSVLPSYHWENNPYCVEEQLAGGSGEGQWDESEEWQAKIKKMKSYIETDGACNYLEVPHEAWDDEGNGDDSTLTQECITYLETLED